MRKNIIIAIIIIIIVAIIAGGLLFFMFGGPVFSDFYCNKADKQFEKENYNKAEEFYSAALYFDKKSSRAVLGLYDVYIAKNESEKAIGFIIDGLKMNNQSVELNTKLIELYVINDQLDRALEHINDFGEKFGEYHPVLEVIDKNRPKPLIYELNQDKYPDVIEVNITIPNDCAVYYTIDGSVPSIKGAKLDGLIVIEDGDAEIRAIAVNKKNMPSDELKLTYGMGAGSETLIFNDEAFEKKIRTEIGKTEGAIREKDVDNVDTLYFNAGSGVKDFSDIKHFKNLVELKISGLSGAKNYIEIGGLYNLRELSITNCGIMSTDMPNFSSLPNLRILILDDNKLTSLPFLSGAANLEILSCKGNNISTISHISGLRSLTELYLNDNSIHDVNPLVSLEKFKRLAISDNNISDVSAIGSIYSLVYIDLENNNVSKIAPLGNLNQLTELYVSGNPVSDYADFPNAEVYIIRKLHIH